MRAVNGRMKWLMQRLEVLLSGCARSYRPGAADTQQLETMINEKMI